MPAQVGHFSWRKHWWFAAFAGLAALVSNLPVVHWPSLIGLLLVSNQFYFPP
jgi:hypothetical protein